MKIKKEYNPDEEMRKAARNSLILSTIALLLGLALVAWGVSLLPELFRALREIAI